MRRATIWTKGGLVYWRLYASPALNELTPQVVKTVSCRNSHDYQYFQKICQSLEADKRNLCLKLSNHSGILHASRHHKRLWNIRPTEQCQITNLAVFWHMAWWRHQINVTGPLCGKFTGHRWIPLTKANDALLDVFFDLRLNKPLSKQSWRRWFERPSRSLYRCCNGMVTFG